MDKSKQKEVGIDPFKTETLGSTFGKASVALTVIKLT